MEISGAAAEIHRGHRRRGASDRGGDRKYDPFRGLCRVDRMWLRR